MLTKSEFDGIGGARAYSKDVSGLAVNDLKSLAWKCQRLGKQVDPNIFSKLESLNGHDILIVRNGDGYTILAVNG